MRINVIVVLQTVSGARSPEIAFFVKIDFIFGGHHGPHANVEFPLFIQQGLFDVLLDDEVLMVVAVLALINIVKHLV